MDMWTGACVFGAGVISGLYLMSEIYADRERVRKRERKAAERREAEARAYLGAMNEELNNKSALLQQMQNDRLYDAAWTDGYEAGRHDVLQGVTIGDVVRFSRIRNARRVSNER